MLRRKVDGASTVEYGLMAGFIAAPIIAIAMTLGGYLSPVQPIAGEMATAGAHDICWDIFDFKAEQKQGPCELRLSRTDLPGR